MRSTKFAPSGAIHPETLYSLPEFYRASGLGRTTQIRGAKDHGITLPRMRVGRRMFVRGVDAIEYIERLAKAQAAGR